MEKEYNSLKTFCFKEYILDKDSSLLNLFFRIDNKINFKEVLRFTTPINFSTFDEKILNTILKNIHLAFGISYYKTFCPKNIVIETESLTKNESIFWNSFYTNGLGEFFFKNNISPLGLINF